MKETDFIKQNKDKWNEMEQLLSKDSKDPDRLTSLFIETTDDLSFSRTYYPNRSVRVYLNSVAQQVYQTIYKNKNRERGAFRRFWMREIPAAMWYARNPFLYTFLIFVAGFVIGLVSSIYYPEFARIILGDYYIELTEANIQSGNPMAIYGDSSQLEMFYMIAWNNIRILFLTYVLGIIFGLGTIYIVLYNSIMFATFIYFFIERDLFSQCFYAVMLHGTIELSMIIVGGAAGLTLARGLIFPGTYNRLQSLLISARYSIKILLTGSIFLLVAAFIESFATRYTDMPDIIRGAVIFLSFTIVIGYFVWYPRHLHRKGLIKLDTQDEVLSSSQVDSDSGEIKTNGRIFTEVFSIFSLHWKKVIVTASVLSIAFLLYMFAVRTGENNLVIEADYVRYQMLPWFIRSIYIWGDYGGLFLYTRHPSLMLVHMLCLGWLMTFFASLVAKSERKEKTRFGKFALQLLSNTLLAFIPLITLKLPEGLTFFLMLLAWPLTMFISAVSFRENKFFAIGRTFRILSGNFWQLVGLFLSIFGVQWLCMMVTSAPLLYIVVEIFEMNISHEIGFGNDIYTIFYFVIRQFVLLVLFPLTVFGAHQFYMNALERKEAILLRERIQKIGFRKRAYGLEKEM